MARELGGPLLAFIRRITSARHHILQTDGALLQGFAVKHDESAFAALMHRHGPMVLRVCQSILQNEHDAEDVFQATFLVLAHKPKAIRKLDSVASWLHGVAYRLAMKARSEAARRHSRERQAAIMPSAEPKDEVLWRELQPILHQEVDRLPERYRLPFVLCHLEGKTNEEAATLLGWPKGTVLSSLSRARQCLRRRLTRRGLAITSGLLATTSFGTPAPAAVPAALAENTLKAAVLFANGSATVGVISAPVLTLAEGLLHATLVARLKLTALIMLVLGVVGTGAGLTAYHIWTGNHENNVSKPPLPETMNQGNPLAADPTKLAAKDEDMMQGTWIVRSAEQDGRNLVELNGRRFEFAGDRFTVNSGLGEVKGMIPSGAMQGDFALEAAIPKEIDLNGRNWRLQGIYSLERSKLKICLGKSNESRPVELASKPGSKQLLIKLERE
jgi:RNA polymerase sigma factor (sigma-70 family)